ncbi:MAG: SpoVA/SpoVAEb family sporulation membrane protein, partial [Acutalibacteraceae bacterium]
MISKEEYKTLVKKNSKKSPMLKDCSLSFLIGGLICAIGQGFIELYKYLGISETDSMTLCSVTLVFIGVLLTFLRLYDSIAKYAGAGTLVPITGFANSIASPAIEFKTEGYVTGLGAKMFVIAGPV